MHLKRGRNPFKSSKRTESDGRQRDFDKVYGGMFYFLLGCRKWSSNFVLCIQFNQFVFAEIRI